MTAPNDVAPLVLIVSGPSGSGKSTLVQKVLELPGTMPSVSCTTRPRRATEASGKCYDFVTDAEFAAMVQHGDFLEYARVFGKHSYGTPKKWLEESRKTGLDLVLEIDVQGAAQVKQKLPESVAILFCHLRVKNWNGGCAVAVRIRTKKLPGAWPGRVTRLRNSANITTIV